MKHRHLNEIASEIKSDWGHRLSENAAPHVEAMSSITSVGDSYGADTGLSAVAYFLANAQTWRGEVARRVKLELRSILKNSGYK